MKRKKLISFLCAAVCLLSLAACGKTAEDAAYAGTTITGKVTAIKESTVTLQLGELTEEEGSGGSRPDLPDAPSGEAGTAGTELGTPPDKPAGDNSNGGGTPPEMPSGSNDGSTPPEMSSGSNDGGTPPEMPSGTPGGTRAFTAGEESTEVDLSGATITKASDTVSISDIQVGDILQVTYQEDGKVKTVVIVSLEGGPSGQFPGGGTFGGSAEVTQGDSANTLSEDGTYSGLTYTSTGDDENALRVDGATVTLDEITVSKSAGATSNTENGDFYGVNAALLATNGASVTITNAKITSSAQNGNGVFSYGSGTTVNISDSTIITTADNSGGIQTTGGGTTNASNLTAETSGNSSAAIRSDRGGGTVCVTGGSYTSNGYNSPAVYSTAAITVSDATLTANHSEALVIEGKNSILLNDCTVTGNMSDTEGASSDENVHNVMIYQSMSGDADVGTSTFTMNGGSLTAKNGDMFYVTNTHCILTLSGVQLENEDAEAYLLRVVGNSASRGWGTAGSNGAQVEFTADAQALSGRIVVDTISTLNLTLKNGSSFTGTVNVIENEQNGEAVSSNAVITIESGCIWELTGDCTVTSLSNYGTIHLNGHTITLADGTVLK